MHSRSNTTLVGVFIVLRTHPNISRFLTPITPHKSHRSSVAHRCRAAPARDARRRGVRSRGPFALPTSPSSASSGAAEALPSARNRPAQPTAAATAAATPCATCRSARGPRAPPSRPVAAPDGPRSRPTHRSRPVRGHGPRLSASATPNAAVLHAPSARLVGRSSPPLRPPSGDRALL